MAKRSEHSLEELKALVLEAAETIVREEGFSRLTVRKIASEVGYTVGSIYMVFANMADLMMQLNARTLDAIAELLRQEQASSATQPLETLSRAYLSYAGRNFNRWRMLVEYPLQAEADIPLWYQEKFDNVAALFEAQFLEFAPALPEDHAKRAARALWYSIHGICTLSLTGHPDNAVIHEIENTIEVLVRNFMRGWAASPDRCS